MSNRGLPFFEEMVEDSRLGRIKRRSGAHVGADGSTVEWSVVELDGEDGADAVMGEAVSSESGNGNKRVKLGDWLMHWLMAVKNGMDRLGWEGDERYWSITLHWEPDHHGDGVKSKELLPGSGIVRFSRPNAL
jgi:hypothetical protein